ncbi:HipA domain-containing protein [Thioclava kandeliae]|uniref:HipA domain-containing protein n=1 Tax=Thioclava kandeliae TaxID=3070818 RepID=A0ABV1SJL2_9RHOB
MLALDVHLEGVAGPVAELARDDHGRTSLRYLREDLPHPLSLSLPVREAPYGDAQTRGFFANMMFENNQQLDQVLARYRLERSDFVGLLEHLGSDCPGAISVGPKGQGGAKIPGDMSRDYDPLTPEDLHQIIADLRDRRPPLGQRKDPSPLAGVQGKLALTRLSDGRFALPKAGRRVPTTHILKVPRASEMALVGQEQAAMALLARLVDHPVAQTEILGEGELRGLLVTRFDRHIHGETLHRIHQEDFAQALGLPPLLKYTRNAGPGARFDAEAMGRIIAACASPGAARLALFTLTMANLLLGNSDNHAKNHALLWQGPRPDLAPAYDVLPIIMDREVTHELAFPIGHARLLDEVTHSDLDQFARALGMRRITAALQGRIRSLLGTAFEAHALMRGPQSKGLRDVIAEQGSHLAQLFAYDDPIPEGDLVPLNRP